MTERLDNDQIMQRITDVNSDLKQYLELAPILRPTLSAPKVKTGDAPLPIPPDLFLKPSV